MDYNFKNLVFEGGGVKGIAYGGALKVLEEKDHLKNIERVAGTSAGAITAVLLSLDYTVEDVSKIIAETDFSSFEDRSMLPINIKRLISRFGWFKGDSFKAWIGELIKEKTGSERFNFRDLKNAIQFDNANFKNLYTVSTNLSQQFAEVFSAENTPSVPIQDAIRMSMSIPLYFQSILKFGDVMVDGGVAYNYPVDLFDHTKYVSNPANTGKEKPDENGNVFNSETIGFRLDSREVIRYNSDNWKNVPVKIKGMKDYALALINFMMEKANKAHLEIKDWNRTIFIDTMGVKTTDFDLSQEKIEQLIKSGETAVVDYFKWKDKDVEWSKMPE